MATVQSGAARLIRSPGAIREGVRVLGLADAMGLRKIREPIIELTLAHLQDAANAAATAGIGQSAAAILADPAPSPRELASALRQLADALEDNPIPHSEARELASVFGWDRLASMVHASPASVRRYAAATRDTPDAIAERLHWLAKVVGDLRGAYNEIGIRRWFDRPRAQLQGRTPRSLLTPGWTPDDAEIVAVRGLARALSGAGAT